MVWKKNYITAVLWGFIYRVWVRGIVVLDAYKNSATGVQFPASAKYHVMMTLGKSTLP